MLNRPFLDFGSSKKGWLAAETAIADTRLLSHNHGFGISFAKINDAGKNRSRKVAKKTLAKSFIKIQLLEHSLTHWMIQNIF